MVSDDTPRDARLRVLSGNYETGRKRSDDSPARKPGEPPLYQPQCQEAVEDVAFGGWPAETRSSNKGVMLGRCATLCLELA